jgi:hypothetical protein
VRCGKCPVAPCNAPRDCGVPSAKGRFTLPGPRLRCTTAGLRLIAFCDPTGASLIKVAALRIGPPHNHATGRCRYAAEMRN